MTDILRAKYCYINLEKSRYVLVYNCPTPLPNIGNRPSDVEKFINLSLAKLQLSYVDLYLIHTPFGLNYRDDETMIPMKPDNTVDLDLSTDLQALWKVNDSIPHSWKMEEQVDLGKAKAIGVSNFSIKQVDKILQVARIRPVTNQVELHIYNQQRELQEHLSKKNITLTAYSSLGTAGTIHFLEQLGTKCELPNLMENPTVKKIAGEVNKTSAQVLLRFVIQRGIATIPKSTNPQRIKQNLDVFNFELTPDQMNRLFILDKKVRILRFEEIFKNVESHPEYPF
ncbi:hypothetical protein RUM44_000380 [Polyplax serrata]|uniref:NADP-dependent oxidoreductase domain-containing protein n=1 Tax=Polyplax serrata TaxID=468196 RepID=A0ABR1B5C3_POLSC